MGELLAFTPAPICRGIPFPPRFRRRVEAVTAQLTTRWKASASAFLMPVVEVVAFLTLSADPNHVDVFVCTLEHARDMVPDTSRGAVLLAELAVSPPPGRIRAVVLGEGSLFLVWIACLPAVVGCAP